MGGVCSPTYASGDHVIHVAPARAAADRHPSMRVTLAFGGGLELLFGGQRELTADLSQPEDRPLNASDVIFYAKDKLLTDRPELFVKNDSVRPGILVLINDVDWELSGQLNTEIEENDTIVFISTLHGG